MVPSDTKNQSDQNKTFRDVLGGLWVLGRMFGHEFHALLIFQEFLIADDFAALFGFGPPFFSNLGPRNPGFFPKGGFCGFNGFCGFFGWVLWVFSTN